MKDLIKQKNIIVQKWLDAVIDSYQPETALFFNNNSNQFKNPAGILIKKSIETLALFVLKGSDPGGGSDPGTGSDRDAATRAPTDILLRAVQDFSPSGAVDFIPALRELCGRLPGGRCHAAWPALTSCFSWRHLPERREKISGLRVRSCGGGMLRAAEGKE